MSARPRSHTITIMIPGNGNKPSIPPILAFAILLLLSLYVFKDILSGMNAPFGISYKNDHPWSEVISPREASRIESFIKDPILQTWPWLKYAHEQLHKGDFPLWNTDQFSGMPFLANRLTGLLNPLVLIPVYFFDPINAQVFIYFIHYLLAGFFLFLFLRELKLDSPVAMLGTIAYLLQGAYIPWDGISCTDGAYFPMCMYFLERMLNRRDKTGIIGFIISFWFFAVTGYPQFLVYSVYVFFAWVIFSGSLKLKPIVKRLSALSIIIIIAVLMGAMQLLPTAEFFEQSPRIGHAFEQHLATINPLEQVDSPVTLLRLFFPKFWGDYLTDKENLYEESVMKTYLHGYAGILFAFGALFLPLIWRNRRARIWAIIFILGSLFVAWNKFFMFAVAILPGFRISQVKPHFMTNVAMIITACYVLNYLTANLRTSEILFKKLARVNFWMLASILGIVTLIVICVFNPSIITEQDQNRNFQMLKGFIFIIASTYGLMLFRSGRISLNLTYALIIFIAIIDLLPYHTHIMVEVPRDRAIFTTPGIEYLQERMDPNNPFRIFRDRRQHMLPPNSPILLGLQEIGGFDSMLVGDYVDYFRAIDSNMAANPRLLDVPSNPDVYNLPFWDFLGVRYFVSPERVNYLPPDWEIVYENEMVIYENPDWLPRWYCVNDFIPAGGVGPSFEFSRNIDPSTSVVIDVEGDAAINQPQLPLWDSYEPGKVELISYSADEVVLNVEAEDSTFLVFSDTYYPGWKVWVDGKPGTVKRTDGIIKGVWILAGNHEVRFLYDPISWKIGWALALLGLILLPLTIKYVKKLLSPDV
ncbi:MAG: YfhO family protein [bacterium]|nr:YfhO family protein [bacterium]